MIVRVLLEQCEHYDDLRFAYDDEGSSFPALREEALDYARIVAELFLSAWREDVDIHEAAVPGLEPLGALLALEVIKSCEVILADEEPDRQLLLSEDELDLLLHNPLMERWWEHALPRDEVAPPRFGSGAPVADVAPTERAEAERAVAAIAACLDESVADYRALLAEREPGADDALRDRARRRAVEITRLTLGNFRRNVDFGQLEPELHPVDAGVLLSRIADSCTVLAAPAGDFDRYAMTAAELDAALAGAELRAWRDALAQRS